MKTIFVGTVLGAHVVFVKVAQESQQATPL